jgi:hypothetical protein
MTVRSPHKALCLFVLLGTGLLSGCAPQEQPPANPPKLPPVPKQPEGGPEADRYRSGGQGAYKPPTAGTAK